MQLIELSPYFLYNWIELMFVNLLIGECEK